MKLIFEYCGISRQAHYQALARERLVAERELLYVHLMGEIRDMHPGMGLRKMYDQFQPEGIGRDGFIALGLREGFRLRVFRNPARTTWRDKRSAFPNLLVGKKFTDVNQLWSSDITYFSLGERFYYIVFILDVYSRKIIGYSVADHLRATNNIAALKMAFRLRGIPHYNNELIHHSDRGTQYTSQAYVEKLTNAGIQISMCQEVLENSHIERVNGIIKNEYLKHWEINNEKELKKALKEAVNNYNKRLHRSLNSKTPNEFEEALKKNPHIEREPLKVFHYNRNSKDNPNQMTLF